MLADNSCAAVANHHQLKLDCVSKLLMTAIFVFTPDGSAEAKAVSQAVCSRTSVRLWAPFCVRWMKLGGWWLRTPP